MPSTLDSLTRQAMTLAPEQREALIARIQDSLAPQTELHPDWSTEIDRRISALEAGQVRLLDASEMLTRLSQHIRDRQPT